MIAFQGDPAVKEKYLARVRQHREADQLVQGYGYWSGGKGCAVGCTIHGGDHGAYETELGIPRIIARIEDCIFEGLDKDPARLWPERFLSAVPVGADLSLVHHAFFAWLLRSDLLTRNDLNRDAIEIVAELHSAAARGEAVTLEQWESARSAAECAAESAWSAAESAWSAARSAECAAECAAESAWSAAESAWSAARSAESAWSAARSAAESAWSAARSAESAWSAAWNSMANKLEELLAAAPLAERSAV